MRPYRELLAKGRASMESELWNGEYFLQKIAWRDLRAADPTAIRSYSPEAMELLEREGPKYQYGTGCLSDGVLGAWIAACCGIDEFLDRRKVESHLQAVHRHNFRQDLSQHANPQRPTYALGHEAGLLLCAGPGRGPDAALCLQQRSVDGHRVSGRFSPDGAGSRGGGAGDRARLRDRYDGRIRNPFNEYECGHWYAWAMASYGLLQGMTGVRYDAVDRTLTIRPSSAGDFRAFLSTATGYGSGGDSRWPAVRRGCARGDPLREDRLPALCVIPEEVSSYELRYVEDQA